ncbi:MULTISPECIES: S1C family serine protease [Ruminococcus]|uniref:Peptidase S1 and S6 chymotrypsin/Hap n=1 Tax=Ruminococcus albus (strain ATCC 27210 / DSM 20455 / JCM 14654 / NCDO 2250 / 7) TaxID=697329 RepID=E6UFR5_RUMA7|nr:MULTISPECIES: trypsin-like peptidase domain-containing protein [Ruminococcus]ADU23054.1 peptidase S1 and S6 chymotrypsin/Hap [Ruminococcus albus 7 = DSM 20455]MCR5021377.1 trypsin-like peptidase domain-containing protein [Ruminococcus sp.]
MSEYNGGGYPPYNDNGAPSVQQPYVNRESYGEPRYYDPQGAANEYSYQPPVRKSSAGRKILTAFAAMVGVAAIAVTSIVGYRIVVGKDNITPADRRNNNISDTAVENKGIDPQTASFSRSDLPTLEQLAAPDDAMKIPDIISKMSPSVVGISCITDKGIGTGSGIVLSEDGFIITNAHVIKDAQSISVVLPPYYGNNNESQDDLTYTAVNVGKDSQTDLAVLKIDRNDLVKAEIGKSSEVQVGELAIVIGNPLGLDLANTATSGIISAKDRTITVEDITMKVFQTDASINGGNSGGALINAYGQVIGITSAKVASAEVEGLGFAIPIDDALPIVSDLMTYGYVTGRPSLGITGADVKPAYSTYYGIPQGFLVKTVTPGSGAEAAGLKENDIIIAIDNTIINGIVQLNDVKNKHKPGDTVTLTVYRSNRKININVVLDESTGEEASVPQGSQKEDDYYDRYNDYDYYYDPFSFFGGF